MTESSRKVLPSNTAALGTVSNTGGLSGNLQNTAPVVASLAVTLKDLVRFRQGMAKLGLWLKDELFRFWIGRTDGKDSWKLRARTQSTEH